MAVLGKRKARTTEPEAPAASDAQSIQDIFRRHFEAQFEPLPDSGKKRKGDDAEGGESDESEAGDEDEWGGLSAEDQEEEDEDDDDDEDESDEEGEAVEVVDHSSHAPKEKAMSKAELKAFMSSRPRDPTNPTTSSTATQSTPSTSTKPLPEDAPSLLAQDLELRRLISESHLLAPKASFSSKITTSTTLPNSEAPKLFSSGKTRRKATDLRLQSLGSKGSIYKQEKMPMNMRKGMAAARAESEKRRRTEAKENGVVLERETGGAGAGKSAKRRRDGGGVDRPGIGRLKGAQLKISERDVQSIENSRDTFGRRRR